jgi:uncharacterized protein (TIGR02118 family)
MEPGSAYRVFFVIYRRDDLTHDEFLTHYLEIHVPIAKRFEKLRSYEIFPLPAGEHGERQPDAFSVMTFDTRADFEAVVASPEFAEAVADNKLYVERFETYAVDHVKAV